MTSGLDFLNSLLTDDCGFGLVLLSHLCLQLPVVFLCQLKNQKRKKKRYNQTKLQNAHYNCLQGLKQSPLTTQVTFLLYFPLHSHFTAGTLASSFSSNWQVH